MANHCTALTAWGISCTGSSFASNANSKKTSAFRRGECWSNGVIRRTGSATPAGPKHSGYPEASVENIEHTVFSSPMIHYSITPRGNRTIRDKIIASENMLVCDELEKGNPFA